MKNLLKSILFIGFFYSVVLPCSAQWKLGIKGGLNVSTISGLESAIRKIEMKATTVGVQPGDYFVDYKPGFHLGMVAQYDFTQHFFFQPELLFSMQGAMVAGTEVKNDSEGYLNFIQLPIYAGYKIKAESNLDVILGIGPYLAYGIAGGKGAYGDDGRFTRFDSGLSAMGGIQLNKFQITAGYDWGLVDEMNIDGWKTTKESLGLSSICNRNIKVSLVYVF